MSITIDATETQLLHDVERAQQKFDRSRPGSMQRFFLIGELAFAKARLAGYQADSNATLMQRMPGEALEDRPNADPIWYDDRD